MYRLFLMVLVILLITGCQGAGEIPTPEGRVRIGTGNAGGVYAVYGAGLAEAIRESLTRVKADAVVSDGSVENIRMVVSREVEVGFALADVAADAVSGRAPFTRPLPIVALANLYENYVQLVVRADGPVQSLRDLVGRRVSVGSRASGTAVVAERILTVAGISDEVTRRNMDIQTSARALADKEIDAFFWSGGLPSDAITDLSRHTDVRLIDLKEITKPLLRVYGELYTETTVPASVYGLSSAVTTVSVPNYLVVARDMPSDTAYWLTKVLFDKQQKLAQAHPEGHRLNQWAAIRTYPLQLHEGAIRWYRATHR
ncbi:TAXI family TRAP transporter solute-binding subunit [Microbispora rosea]|uniref:TAXI family TRAP transporter solute-binding subunit n=1 Tax=Microbispora rosea TaxID=58117 RepID=UPI0034447427